MSTAVPDRIEKQVMLRAPLVRVWKALSDSREFGQWFGVRFDGPFVAGQTVTGVMAPTVADPEVARQQQPYEGMRFEFVIDRVEPERLFSFRWHPAAIDPSIDYSHEPMTLVVFTLEPRPDGVLLTVVETGFDRIPLERRARAFTMNQGGWQMQIALVEKYLARPA